jgi:hypothetical protein
VLKLVVRVVCQMMIGFNWPIIGRVAYFFVS